MSSSAGGIRPAAVSAASVTATANIQTWTAISMRRRSNVSASAPDGSASNRIGSMLAVCTSATSVAALGSSTSSHCAPTVCIQVPTLLASMASQSARNTAMRNGSHAGAGVGRDGAGAGGSATLIERTVPRATVP